MSLFGQRSFVEQGLRGQGRGNRDDLGCESTLGAGQTIECQSIYCREKGAFVVSIRME